MPSGASRPVWPVWLALCATPAAAPAVPVPEVIGCFTQQSDGGAVAYLDLVTGAVRPLPRADLGAMTPGPAGWLAGQAGRLTGGTGGQPLPLGSDWSEWTPLGWLGDRVLIDYDPCIDIPVPEVQVLLDPATGHTATSPLGGTVAWCATTVRGFLAVSVEESGLIVTERGPTFGIRRTWTIAGEPRTLVGAWWIGKRFLLLGSQRRAPGAGSHGEPDTEAVDLLDLWSGLVRRLPGQYELTVCAGRTRDEVLCERPVSASGAVCGLVALDLRTMAEQVLLPAVAAANGHTPDRPGLPDYFAPLGLREQGTVVIGHERTWSERGGRLVAVRLADGRKQVLHENVAQAAAVCDR